MLRKLRENKIFQIIKSIIKFVFTLFCIFLILIIVIQRFSNNEITVMGFRLFNVATESMVPKYNVGDILIVKTVDTDEIKVGDDVTYMGKVGSFSGRIVTHQVIKIDVNDDGSKVFHTKGIANEVEDPKISGDQIYGVVIYKMIAITYFSALINNMYGMYILLIGSVAVVMVMEARDYKRMEREEEEESTADDEDTSKSKNKMRERRRKRQQQYKK